MKTLTTILLSILAIFLALALPARVMAQTVPGPVIPALGLDLPASSPTCEGGTGQPWDFSYGTCYLPSGVVLGSPFLTHVRVTLTPTSGPAVVRTIPRAQVTRETTAARCGTGSVPCLRIDNIPALPNVQNITVQFVDAEGRSGGASTPVPFTGNPPTVPAAAGPRLPNP